MKALKAVFVLLILANASISLAETKLVLGENIKVGMKLNEVFKLLGSPETLGSIRGTGVDSDSISLKYSGVGLLFHVINGTDKIEVIEANKDFKGTFASGLTLGSKYQKVFETYGLPKTLSSNVAQYPKLGIQFIIANEKVFSAVLFNKESKHLIVRQITQK